jgi:hypothetical protein
MGLFPKEQGATDLALGEAPRRMFWTREQGTRQLLFLLAAVAVIWIIAGRVLDNVLLSKHWGKLQAMPEGLTVVGTLNARGNYERNMFRIVAANKTSRVELTDFGWNSIFDPRNGPLCNDRAAHAIEKARSTDSDVGFAMLVPFLRAAVAKSLGDEGAFKALRGDEPIHVARDAGDKNSKEVVSTLNALIKQYSGETDRAEGDSQNDVPEVSSGSGHSVEHGIALPADTVADVCPVVLTGPLFNDAWLEEQPSNIFTGKAYTVHLGLTGEGRSRFFQWSHEHANEQMAFVLGHQVVMAGIVPQTLDVSTLDVRNVPDEMAAREVVEWINKHKP